MCMLKHKSSQCRLGRHAFKVYPLIVTEQNNDNPSSDIIQKQQQQTAAAATSRSIPPGQAD